MNVVYATDENYAFLTGISIVSLFENNRDMEINVYVIGDGIAEEDQGRIQSLSDRYHQKIFILEQPDLEKLAGVRIEISDWSLTAFVRLFLPELLPRQVDRVLWLDCDTIVTDSLAGLWGTELLKGGVRALCLIVLLILKEYRVFLKKSFILTRAYC